MKSIHPLTVSQPRKRTRERQLEEILGLAWSHALCSLAKERHSGSWTGSCKKSGFPLFLVNLEDLNKSMIMHKFILHASHSSGLVLLIPLCSGALCPLKPEVSFPPPTQFHTGHLPDQFALSNTLFSPWQLSGGKTAFPLTSLDLHLDSSSCQLF